MTAPLTPEQIAEVASALQPELWKLFLLGALVGALVSWSLLPTRERVSGYMFPALSEAYLDGLSSRFRRRPTTQYARVLMRRDRVLFRRVWRLRLQNVTRHGKFLFLILYK
ncbi:hypothetical protein [Paraherbaspirillum soli]|uniref:Uncharacterized protein n=1 Tax=Paraherbaspirillum soli TaxID=631222 RepID=A0ABW0MEA5_9BURK